MISVGLTNTRNSFVQKNIRLHSLFLRTLNLTVIDLLDDGRGVLTVDSAADRVASSQNLLHRAGELVGVGALAEDLGHLNDLIESDVAAVLDYLLQSRP